MIRTEVLAATRASLKEASADSMFSDSQLGVLIDQTLREIAAREPLRKRACLAIIDNTYAVDISPLTYLKIRFAEWPVGNNGFDPIYRKFTPYGTEIVLDLSHKPVIASVLLSGILTFTANSRNVTGSGTSFLTQLVGGDNGHLICKSSGSKYYQVAYVTSDTALTLSQPYEETSGADTINLTKYRDRNSCARIEYGAAYTVTSASDLPTARDQILCLGTSANALYVYLTSKLTTDDVQADSDLINARTNINSANPGGDLAGKYTNIAQVGQARGVSVSQRTLILTTWQQYQNALDTLGYAEDRNLGNYSRE